jgi:thioesterase domain-containing protein
VYSYRDLAGRLAGHEGVGPIYGLEARGLGPLAEGEGPAETVEELAAEYLDAIRKPRPHREGAPYRLGGWSFGALVAFEMARTLAAEGEDVTVVLIDPSAPNVGAADASRPEGMPAEDDARSVAFLARDLAAMGGAKPPVTEKELAQVEPERRLGLFVERAAAAGLLPPDVGVEAVRRIAAVYRANAGAAVVYRPEPLTGARVLALFAEESPGGERRTATWNALAGGSLEERRLAGDHYTLLQEPRVGALADALVELLEGRPVAVGSEGSPSNDGDS